MPSFGETLKELREKAGLSQRDLAEKAGTSQKAISWWETGEREPSISNLHKLCVALGVSCQVFMPPPATSAGAAPPRRGPKSQRPRA
jgi:transcriptional regulator with XRE-family HTH domain